MSFGPSPITALTAATAEADTLIPCSEDGSRNEISLGVLLQALGQVGSVTPTALSASTDNWAAATGTINYISSSAAYNLTGLVAEANGSPKLLWNTGTFPITLVNSATSVAVNQFTCAGGASIVLGPGEVALTIYNTTTSRWLVTKVRSDIAQGTLIARQPSGVAGTDEIQISHDGTNVIIANKDAAGTVRFPNPAAPAEYLQITKAGTAGVITNVGSGAGPLVMASDAAGSVVLALGGLYKAFLTTSRLALASDYQFAFSSTTNGDGTADTGLKRAAAGQIQATDGSTGLGGMIVRGDATMPFVVRQSGGVAGTDEIQSYHIGTAGYIDCKDGNLYIRCPVNKKIQFVNTSDSSAMAVALQGSLDLEWTAPIRMGADATTFDTGLKRAAAGVVAVTDGSSGNGTLQVGPGTGAIPSLAFSTETSTGFYLSSTNNPTLAIGGYAIQKTDGNGLMVVGSSGGVGWRSETVVTAGTTDTSITRLAAGVVGVSNWLQNTGGTKRLTADVTNATTTMANLTDLSITLIAGRKYAGRLTIKCSDDVPADGIAFDLNGGTATMEALKFAACSTLLAGGTTVNTVAVSSALDTDLIYTTITGETWISISLSFTCNVAGTFIPRFAQAAHTTGTATVALGSWIDLEDVP